MTEHLAYLVKRALIFILFVVKHLEQENFYDQEKRAISEILFLLTIYMELFLLLSTYLLL